MFKLPRIVLAFAATALLTVPAGAATLNAVNIFDPKVVVQDDGVGPKETQALFGTETKRDQVLQNNARAGNDFFLRNGAGSTIGSASFVWGASGTTYNWSLAYDGNNATFTLGGTSVTGTVTSGIWNVVGFFLRADDLIRFSTSRVTVSTTSANGAALSAPLTFTVADGQYASTAYALDAFQTITSLSGTMRFDFTVRGNGSPNSRLAFSVGALQVTPVADVPVPAGLVLALSAIGLLAGAGRLRRGRIAA